MDPAYGERFAQDFNRKVGKLAWDAAQLLKSIEARDGASDSARKTGLAPTKPTIYLAECSRDQRDAREVLEAELKLHGYSIVPNERLPLDDEAGYVATVEHLLARCSLSIHLVGRAYGAVPDGPSQKSVTVIQNEVAARRSRDHALPRLVWLPEGTRSEQTAQQDFIDALHRDADVQRGADLITEDLEKFKGAIHAALKTLERPSQVDPAISNAAPAGGARLLYLICDEKDRKATIPIRRLLRDKGIDVALPAFEGGAAAVRDANQRLLNACDAVMVFYGAGDDAWKRTTDNELKKMRALRTGPALPVSYTYLASPLTSDKQDLIDLAEPNLIDGLSDVPGAGLEALVATLAPGGAAR